MNNMNKLVVFAVVVGLVGALTGAYFLLGPGTIPNPFIPKVPVIKPQDIVPPSLLNSVSDKKEKIVLLGTFDNQETQKTLDDIISLTKGFFSSLVELANTSDSSTFIQFYNETVDEMVDFFLNVSPVDINSIKSVVFVSVIGSNASVTPPSPVEYVSGSNNRTDSIGYNYNNYTYGYVTVYTLTKPAGSLKYCEGSIKVGTRTACKYNLSMVMENFEAFLKNKLEKFNVSESDLDEISFQEAREYLENNNYNVYLLKYNDYILIWSDNLTYIKEVADILDRKTKPAKLNETLIDFFEQTSGRLGVIAAHGVYNYFDQPLSFVTTLGLDYTVSNHTLSGRAKLLLSNETAQEQLKRYLDTTSYMIPGKVGTFDVSEEGQILKITFSVNTKEALDMAKQFLEFFLTQRYSLHNLT